MISYSIDGDGYEQLLARFGLDHLHHPDFSTMLERHNNPTIVMQQQQSLVLHHPAQVRAYGPCTCKSRTTKIPPRSSRTTQESGSISNHHRTCLPPTSPGQAAESSSF